jgi:rhodanese-related sulfurtransferase
LGGRTEVKRVLLESLVVAVLGGLLAFLANALSPRGLELTRNYYPDAGRTSTNLLSLTNSVAGLVGTNAASPWELLAARLKANGLQLAGTNEVLQLFHDPRYEQDLIAFVDARNDEHYQKGHIPGAYLFDYYHPASYLSNVLQVCMMAQEVVVYCNGGDCEDSELSAVMLRDLGVPKEKLLVYGGGMAEWATNNLPIELGSRKSGKLHNAIQSPTPGRTEGLR